ncbi:RcnB family protein [Croceicoccus gelatinilyticus]|uniref:RcnB family protein n=1 Tax=Croceicoccus gelatinilyticus TaxID=2835536 RepID=UPI002357D552|nr:RcnB family protein [Croceicoccus gelatinilyticus]
MKKLIAAAIAAAMIVPAVSTPAEARGKDRYERSDRHDRYERRHDRRDRYERRYSKRDRYDRRHRYDRRDRYARRDYRDYRRYSDRRHWRRGDRFDRRYVHHYRPVYYRDYRRLYAPPRGYRWVRANDDALLIGITSGIVSAIVSNAFYR